MNGEGKLQMKKRETPETKIGYDLDKRTKGVFAIMKKFLITYANDIQKKATQHHKEYLGGEKFRSEFIDKYQKNHIKIVEEVSKNLHSGDIKKSSAIFKKLGERIAIDSVKDGLTINEAIDGIIFLKQAIWQKMETHGVLDMLTTKDFYQLSHAMGTYADVVTAEIAFTYHSNYVDHIKNEKTKVEQAVKLRDNFISAASHELKTPITSLKLYLQGMKSKTEKIDENDKLTNYMEKMDNQLNRLTILVEDLLSVSKLQHGKLEFTMTAFDLNALIEEAVEAIGGTSTKHRIFIEGKSKKHVYGDRYRLYQVLTNLITNAIKYSPSANKIIIRVTDSKDRAVVEVQDFGIGITSEHQKKIFDEFYRVLDSENKTFSGMGMGLFIANEIIKRHGSKINVTSKKGTGSTFYFTLPFKNKLD
jgi:signal transduction histidine kinase